MVVESRVGLRPNPSSLRVVVVECEGTITEQFSGQGHQVFVARTVEQAVSIARNLSADLAVLHVKPRCSVAFDAQVRSLRQASPGCQVIVVADEPTLQMAIELMRAGVRDLVSAPVDWPTLREAISRVGEARANGKRDSVETEERAFAARHRLTPRQAEVLSCLLKGLANKEIAADLSIAVRTLEDHVSGLLRKTGTSEVRSLLALYRSHTRTLLAAHGDPRVGLPDIPCGSVAESSFASATQYASARHRSVR